MFERLTKRCDLGLSEFEEICFINPDDVEGMYTLDEIVGFGSYETRFAIANRIAAYEDSGMSPEEVQELAKAKADGRVVEVTQGKWLPHTNVTVKCSVCGGLYSPYKYCPNCGTRMSCEAAEKAIAEVGE